MNPYEFAMKMEENGQAMYLQLAEKANLESVKNIFKMLAYDEQKHFETFQRMKGTDSGKAMENSTALDGAKNAFADLKKQRDEVANLESDIPVYTKAMEIEAESAKIYREAAQKESDPAVREVLEQIAQEEEKHYNILENLYLFANAPTQYQEWQEFGHTRNLDQFGRRVED